MMMIDSTDAHERLIAGACACAGPPRYARAAFPVDIVDRLAGMAGTPGLDDIHMPSAIAAIARGMHGQMGEVTKADVGKALVDAGSAYLDNPTDIKKMLAPIFALATLASQAIPPPWGQIVGLVLQAVEAGVNVIADILNQSIAAIPSHVPAAYSVPMMAWVKDNLGSLFLECVKDFVADRIGFFAPSNLPGGFNAKTSGRVAFMLYKKLGELGANPADAAIVGYVACSGQQENKGDWRPWDPTAALSYAKVISPTAGESNYKNRAKIQELWKANADARGLEGVDKSAWGKAAKSDPKTEKELNKSGLKVEDNSMLYVGAAAALVAVILLTRR